MTSLTGTIFAGCTSLTEVNIPDAMTEIQRGLFKDAPLTTLYIGKGTKKISPDAFYKGVADFATGMYFKTKSLENLVIDTGNETFCAEGTTLLSRDGKTLIAELGDPVCAVIPEGVEEISASNTSIKDFDITFIRPGDAFTIRLDIVNNGTLDAKLETFKISNIVCTYNNGSSADDYCDKHISYSIKYKDGSSIKKDDVLEAGETKTVVFKMSYADNAPVLYDEVISIDDMNMSFVYVQK